MSIGTGHLFEKALVPFLLARFSESSYTFVEQPRLEWEGYSGAADFLISGKTTSDAYVIDAKAFRSDTLRDIKERKLSDAWGYPTQLAIYQRAAAALLPNHTVQAQWYVWSVPKGKLFVVEQDARVCRQKAEVARQRLVTFTEVKRLLQERKFAEASTLATEQESECIPPKGWLYGNVCAATSFHYQPYAPLFFPEAEEEEDEGLPITGEPLRLLVEKLMHDSHTPDTNLSFYEDYLSTTGQLSR